MKQELTEEQIKVLRRKQCVWKLRKKSVDEKIFTVPQTIELLGCLVNSPEEQPVN